MKEHDNRREVRCGHCRRLLAKGEALDLTIKCPRCGTLNHVRGMSPDAEGPRASDRSGPCTQQMKNA